MTFAPIGLRGRGHSSKAIGVLWHEAIPGRKVENISNAYVKAFSFANVGDFKDWVIWADNCGGQNKCWTLYTILVGIVNSPEFNIEKITIRYFTVGHSFMSADNFHRMVEQEMKAWTKSIILHILSSELVMSESPLSCRIPTFTNTKVKVNC